MIAPLLFTGAAVSMVAAAIALGRRSEAQRAEAMRSIAARLGWGYRDEVSFETIPDLDRFELFTAGRRRRLTNVMTSPAGDPRAVLFDFTYTTGGGKSQATHRQTVYYGVSDNLDLPQFSLRPQRFYHEIAKAFGYQDIDLETHPRFSAMFLLRGGDADAVRTAFNDAVVQFFEKQEGVCAAGMGRELLYWRPGTRVVDTDVERFVQAGMEATRLYSTGSG